MTHEEEIKKNARAWADAERSAQVAYKQSQEAKKMYDDAKAHADILKKEAAKAVGANIRDRIISAGDGQVVVITYREQGNLVTLKDLIS